MDSPLTLGLALALGAALVAVVVLAAQLRRARRATEAALVATRAESEALRERVEGLAARLDRRETTDAAAAYVITDAGDTVEPVAPRPVASDRVVLNAALGEPLVKAVALGHGVRRALGAESRNRIRFEMRRESKRARKQRRREMRDAYRESRTSRRPAAPAAEPGVEAA